MSIGIHTIDYSRSPLDASCSQVSRQVCIGLSIARNRRMGEHRERDRCIPFYKAGFESYKPPKQIYLWGGSNIQSNTITGLAMTGSFILDWGVLNRSGYCG
jgi:hypothetical protein